MPYSVEVQAYLLFQYGYDFVWSRNHNDGTYLYQSNKFDADLRSFVNSGFTEAQWDHAMGLTGFVYSAIKIYNYLICQKGRLRKLFEN